MQQVPPQAPGRLRLARRRVDVDAAERLLAETHLAERQIRLALAYRAEYSDEIDDLIDENRTPVEELRSLYPFVEFGT